MKSDQTIIEGSCHCHNIRFVLQWPGSVADIPVRQCGCTFCQKHAGSWTSNPDASLEVVIANPSNTSRYQFGTKSADFLVCSQCGVVPVVLSEIDNQTYSVVNIKTFDNIDTAQLKCTATDFDGEDIGNRLERRKRNWIGRVRLTGG